MPPPEISLHSDEALACIFKENPSWEQGETMFLFNYLFQKSALVRKYTLTQKAVSRWHNHAPFSVGPSDTQTING